MVEIGIDVGHLRNLCTQEIACLGDEERALLNHSRVGREIVAFGHSRNGHFIKL